MNEPVRNLETLEWVGGHPALDFVNTVHSWHTRDHRDYLHGYDDFLQWALAADMLWPNSARAFARRPDAEKRQAFDEMRALRDSLHKLFAALAKNERLPQEALDHLNGLIRRTVAWRWLAADPGTGNKELCCTWDFSNAPAYAALGPIAWKAAELLELGPLDRIKKCPAENCGWLFMDTSKNRSRHWCSMKTCGNAAKVKRFRERH